MLKLREKIFLFDVNHTLINTAMGHLQAMSNMVKALEESGIKKNQAKNIIRRVHFATSLMIAGFLITDESEWDYVPGGKEGYKELVSKINDYQSTVLKEWGFIKKWSREVFLKIAADEEGIKLNNRIIKKTVDAHWDAITQFAKPFASAKVLFNELKKQNIPAYILTSSDGRLRYKNGKFIYDPSFSEEAKRMRMQELKREGLFFADIIIGDPYDKPTKKFFENGVKVIGKKIGRKVDPKELVMVGNSYEDDIETPLGELNFGMGILVDEGKKKKIIGKNFIIVGDLKDIINLL